MRKLTNKESENLRLLQEKSLKIALIQPTANGLKKSIMDATSQVRDYLKMTGFHEYEQQLQGVENKLIVDARLIKEDSIIFSQASLYRPKTKQGDPRIWFTNLTRLAEANNILGLIIHKNCIFVINLSKLDVEVLLNSEENNPLKDLVEEINS